MQTKSGIAFLGLLLGVTVTAAGQSQQSRIAISAQRVASAMTEAGWRVRPEHVQLLSQLTFAARDTWLQVVQVTHWQDDKLKAELRCHDPRACLPFYVLINKGGTADESGQISPVEDGKQPALEMTVEKPLMKSGDPATLTFSNKGLSITMPVICLQSGHQGQMIRVASADHKRFYKAEIVGPGLLKATAL
jgi:hypothetical protein